MNPKPFSNRLKEALSTKRYTQAKLADEMGLSRSAVYYMTAGMRSPSVDTLIDICNTLGVSPEELLQDYLLKRPVNSSTAAAIGRAYSKASEADRLAVRAILSKFDSDIEVQE